MKRAVMTLALLAGCQATPLRTERVSLTVTQDPINVALSFRNPGESATVTAVSTNACESLLWFDGSAYTDDTVLADDRSALTVRRTSPGASEVELLYVYRPAPLRQALRLDLNVFLTGASNLDAKAAASNPRWLQALDALWAIYTPAQITRGDVRYFDLPVQSAAFGLRTCRSDGTLEPLGARSLFDSVSAAPLGVNVFLAESIDSGDSRRNLTGFSALPGRALNDATPRDGVLIVFDHFDPREDDLLGQTLAHEIGHYLGLFHVREADGTSADPLTDTPKTMPEAQSNLMYYTGTRRVPNLSAEQIRAMRRHPVLRD
jgi:Pregnancy-associated plasma protein-A